MKTICQRGLNYFDILTSDTIGDFRLPDNECIDGKRNIKKPIFTIWCISYRMPGIKVLKEIDIAFNPYTREIILLK